MRAQRKRQRQSRRRDSSTAMGGTSLHRYDVWSGRRYNSRWKLQRNWRGGRQCESGPHPWHEGRVAPRIAGRGEVAAVVRLVRHLDREGGAGGGGEGARLTGAAGVVVRALGGGHATGAGAEIGRAGVTVVVVMGKRRAGTPHGAGLQGEDRAVRWRRGAGLRRHLLIGRQLEGSQKTCDKRNLSSDVASKIL